MAVPVQVKAEMLAAEGSHCLPAQGQYVGVADCQTCAVLPIPCAIQVTSGFQDGPKMGTQPSERKKKMGKIENLQMDKPIASIITRRYLFRRICPSHVLLSSKCSVLARKGICPELQGCNSELIWAVMTICAKPTIGRILLAHTNFHLQHFFPPAVLRRCRATD